MTHEEFIHSILSNVDASGRIKCRERNDLEYKENFGQKSWAKYAKTMASFANNRGGYLLFGVKDNPREIVGVNQAFNNFGQEKLTDFLNGLFAPELSWEASTVEFDGKTIGYIYTDEAEDKPVIAQKFESSEKINSGGYLLSIQGKKREN
jgi:predicted HTH transcriptional regulator